MNININVNVNSYSAHHRTVPLVQSVHRILLKHMRLQQATEAGDVEVWIAQIIAECVPGGRTEHGERTTAVRVELYSWHDEWAAAGRTKVLPLDNASGPPDIVPTWPCPQIFLRLEPRVTVTTEIVKTGQ